MTEIRAQVHERGTEFILRWYCEACESGQSVPFNTRPDAWVNFYHNVVPIHRQDCNVDQVMELVISRSY